MQWEKLNSYLTVCRVQIEKGLTKYQIWLRRGRNAIASLGLQSKDSF